MPTELRKMKFIENWIIIGEINEIEILFFISFYQVA